MTTADRSVIGEVRGTAAGGGGALASSTQRSGRTRLAALSPGAWAAALRAEAAGQAGRLIVWTPFAFGLGAAGYFALKLEPAPAVGAAAAILALVLLAAGRRLSAPALRSAVLLCAVALLGFANGKLAAERARAPVLPEGLGVRRVSGRVVDIVDAAGGKLRLLIRPSAIDGLDPGRLPRRLRVTLREGADVEPGDALAFRAILDPPPAPPSPGGFDFAREAWFSELGGVGLALTAPRPAHLPPMGRGLRLQTGLNALRWRLAERLAARLGDGGAAGLAAAVSTSHQAWLSEEDADALRGSGLAHMLAIAGLHTAAVTGFVYLAVRLGVAAWPWLALRVSGKRLAAAAGLLACVAYLALSGAHPPARRAAITASIAFLAMLCGRRAISMRSLALAALVVLALQPVAVCEPGFQMSFSATAALVALAEAWPRRRERIEAPWFIAWPQHLGGFLAGLASVSLVAGLATAPFALQHFNRVALYGLPANFAADFLASAVLMPALVLFAVGAALGLPPIVLLPVEALTRASADAILGLARLFSGLPGAVSTFPSAPGPALAIAFVAIVFAALWRGRLRWVALPFSLAVLLWPRGEPPVAWVAADGDNAAVVEDGRAVVLKPKVRAFASNAWETRRGLHPPFDPDAEAELAFDCDRSHCTPRPGLRPALGAWWSRKRAPTPEQIDDLCRTSEIAVLRGPAAEAPCPGVLALREPAILKGGSAEVFRTPDGWRVVWANDLRGRRPWSEAAVAPASPRRVSPPRTGEDQPP